MLIDLAHVIIAMVELTLERGDRKHVLIVPVGLRWKQKYFNAHFLFYRGSAYTTVATRTIGETMGFPEVWNEEVHHDSAWRDDGVRSVLVRWEEEFRTQMKCEQAGLNPNIEAVFYTPPRRLEVVEITRTGRTMSATYKH